MAKYKILIKEDFKNIQDYCLSLKFNLLTLGINTEYYLNNYIKDAAVGVFYWIKIPALQNSKFMPLFPPYYSLSNINFKKENDCYNVEQEFNIGSTLNNKGNLEEVLDISEGDEWKIQQYKGIISVKDSIDISRKLANELINNDFIEIDERSVSKKKLKYRPFPSLVHEFSLPDNPNFYLGSRINLKEELAKNLNQCSLKENLVELYQFFKDLNHSYKFF